MSDERRGRENEFEMYVGYLPVPRRFVRFVRVVVPVSLWVLALMALGWAARQGDAGDAVWEDEAPREFAGTVIAKPYPMLLEAGEGGGVQPRLIVEEGKHGGGQRAAKFDGRFVMLRGYRLSRDGREIVELAADEHPIQDATGTPVQLPVIPTGPVTLRGEIVDSKCYLGAMKPGEGKTHKACATLCVRGGIPPMLVSVRDDGTLAYTVICRDASAPVGDDVLAYVGDEVIVEGEGFEIGGVKFVGVGRGGIRRP